MVREGAKVYQLNLAVISTMMTQKSGSGLDGTPNIAVMLRVRATATNLISNYSYEKYDFKMFESSIISTILVIPIRILGTYVFIV